MIELNDKIVKALNEELEVGDLRVKVPLSRDGQFFMFKDRVVDSKRGDLFALNSVKVSQFAVHIGLRTPLKNIIGIDSDLDQSHFGGGFMVAIQGFAQSLLPQQKADHNHWGNWS